MASPRGSRPGPAPRGGSRPPPGCARPRARRLSLGWLLALGALLAPAAASAGIECLDPYDLQQAIEDLAFNGKPKAVIGMEPHCTHGGAEWRVAAVEALPRMGDAPVLPRSRRDKELAAQRGNALGVTVDRHLVTLTVKNKRGLFLTSNQVYTYYFRITFTPVGSSVSGAGAGSLRAGGEFGCAHFIYLVRGNTPEVSFQQLPDAFDRRHRLGGEQARADIRVLGDHADMGKIEGRLDAPPHFAVFRWHRDAPDGTVPLQITTSVAGITWQHSLRIENMCPPDPIALRDGFGVRLYAGMPFVGAGLGIRREYPDWRWATSFDVLWQHPLNILFPDRNYTNTLNLVATPRIGNDTAFLGLSLGMALRDLPGDREAMLVTIPHVTLLSPGGTIGVTVGAAYYGFRKTRLQPMVGIEFDLMGSSEVAPAGGARRRRLSAVPP